MKRIAMIFLCLTLALLLGAGGVWGYTVLTDPNDCRMLEGVTVGGLSVEGMTKAEARDALTAALNSSLYSHALTLELPEETLTLSGEDLSPKVNVADAVRDAYAYGRKEEAAEQTLSLLPYLEVNEAGIRAKLEAYAAAYDTQLRQPEWELSGQQPDLSTANYTDDAADQLLVLTKGVPSLHLDVELVYAQVVEACADAISLCGENRFTVAPEVVPEALPDTLDLEAIYAETRIDPVDDSLDMTSYSFVHGSYGYAFDLEEASRALDAAENGQTTAVPMQVLAPDILADGVYFRDVLGHCETKHTDDENRNTNLRLLCQALDGVVLQPGQEFSYNETVGERTEEKGYKPANAYSGKTMIKDIGGGVCQGSTTLYNCALLADLEILERVCHGARVGYVQLGLDAAVNWNTKTDLRFKNNFNFPIKITAEVSDGYVRMQLLGTDEKDYYIEMRCGNSQEGDIIYAVSYKVKYDKETGEQISKEREAFSTYYPLG